MTGLLFFGPVLALAMLAIWLQDGHSPLYVSRRIGLRGKPFRMVKLRSMVVAAPSIGGSSTAADDNRITSIGRIIRKCKLDEVAQLWNVLRGDMSLVGPRPNVGPGGVDLYTEQERRLLSVRPGITDISSIVFADEADILAGRSDPDLAYNQFIRPGKSRLGLVYVDHASVAVDLRLIWLTGLTIVSRRHALEGVSRLLESFTDPAVPRELIDLARRQKPLEAAPPPGADSIVHNLDVAASTGP